MNSGADKGDATLVRRTRVMSKHELKAEACGNEATHLEFFEITVPVYQGLWGVVSCDKHANKDADPVAGRSPNDLRAACRRVGAEPTF